MGDEPDARITALLSELCVRYGYCLSPDAQNTLLAKPPPEPDAFIDAVLRAEGRDPMLLDTNELRELTEVARKWLNEPLLSKNPNLEGLRRRSLSEVVLAVPP